MRHSALCHHGRPETHLALLLWGRRARRVPSLHDKHFVSAHLVAVTKDTVAARHLHSNSGPTMKGAWSNAWTSAVRMRIAREHARCIARASTHTNINASACKGGATPATKHVAWKNSCSSWCNITVSTPVHDMIKMHQPVGSALHNEMERALAIQLIISSRAG